MKYSEEPLTMHVHLPSGLAKEGTMVLIGIALVASVVFLFKMPVGVDSAYGCFLCWVLTHSLLDAATTVALRSAPITYAFFK